MISSASECRFLRWLGVSARVAWTLRTSNICVSEWTMADVEEIRTLLPEVDVYPGGSGMLAGLDLEVGLVFRSRTH